MTDMPDTTLTSDPSYHADSAEESDDASGYYVPGEPLTDTKAPDGPIAERWSTRKFEARLVSPTNRRKLSVIFIGTGLAGASAAATLGEAGYNVKSFCYQDSPRRAHSIAAQGGINAAKNYKEDGDSVHRLFYDTVKGGDYRSRESNVYRLAEVSANIIDQCVAQGVPFAREYGGLLDNRSFGGVQVSRTFYARGQTGQQLLIGAYQALERQVHAGTVTTYTRHEMLELIVVEDESGQRRARGIVARDMVTGAIETHLADVVVLASGGYGNVFYLSTNAMGSNVTASWRAHRKGAFMANPCYTQIHPTCIPVSGTHQSKLTLMSESLRNDGRIWVPKDKADCAKDPREIPEEARDYYLERIYPSFGNLVPRDIASRAAKYQCDDGRGVGPEVEGVRRGVYLDFAAAIERLGREAVEERYGNLFDMYFRITGENPYEVPMRIYPAVHYVMGGLWIDYDLQSNIPGLFVTGEANYSDHGANRLGASALMQGLADGYFVLPHTIRDYLADGPFEKIADDHPAVVEARTAVQERIEHFLTVNGTRSVDSYHRELGNIMWEYCGMERSEDGLKKAIDLIRTLRDDFHRNVKVLGSADSLNQSLEKAGRVADFLELGELMCIDALNRRESCGSHFRSESQTEDGEALRHDDLYAYVAAWEFTGTADPGSTGASPWADQMGAPVLHKEQLVYTAIKMKQRSYK
jgi:succinate dehydrogenase / fumarate reductase, flavoprotein subunit